MSGPSPSHNPNRLGAAFAIGATLAAISVAGFESRLLAASVAVSIGVVAWIALALHGKKAPAPKEKSDATQGTARSSTARAETRDLIVRDFIDSIPGFVSWVGRDLCYLGVNRSLASVHGRRPEDFVGKPIGFLEPTGNAEVKDLLMRLFAGESDDLSAEIMLKQGNELHAFTMSGIRCNGGSEAVLVGVDVTNRKHFEQQLVEQKDLLNRVLDHIPHGVYAKDAANDFRYIIWNSKMETMFGRRRAEILGKTDHELFEKKEALRQRRIDDFVMSDGNPLELPEETLHSAIAKFPAHSIRVPVVNEAQQRRMLLGIFEDVTDAKKRDDLIRTQQIKLMHASKMTSLGEMSGGIAHEINNPLSVIMGFAKQMVKLLDQVDIDPVALKVYSQKIESQTARIARIVRGLRSFAREASQDPFEKTIVEQLVVESLDLCRQRFAGHRIELDASAIPDSFTLECRRVQISQVLVNLFNNAFDAVQSLPDKWVRVEVLDREAEYEFVVTDSGAGIPQDIAEKILHPFFTTKDVGSGTGLGLSISKGIIESHGGRLYYDGSAANTRFVFTLPKIQATPRAA